MLERRQYKTTEQLRPASNISGLFSLAIFFVFLLSQNADWGSNRILWWGSIGLFLLLFVIERNGVLTLDPKYTLWVLAFAGICVASFLWAIRASLVFTMLKSMVINVMIFLLLRSAIKGEEDVERILALLLGTVIVIVVWLLLTNKAIFEQSVDMNKEADRLGTEGTWNANAVGMMAATAMLIALYFRRKTKSLALRFALIAVLVLMIFVTLLSGSRKALVMILMGFCGFVYLSAKGKRLRAIVLIALVMLGLYYLVMEVPFFYSIIGIRVEGFIASLTGVGDVDSSTMKRDAYVKDAMRVWKENPILGVGLNCYRALNRLDADVYSHNNYTELLANLGIVGTVIYYSAHLYCLVGLLKLKKKDSLVWLLLIVLLIQLVMDYGSVSYNSLSDGILRMLMFCVISIRKTEQGKLQQNCG